MHERRIEAVQAVLAQPDRAKASAAGRTLIADEREFLDLPRCYFQSKCRLALSLDSTG